MANNEELILSWIREDPTISQQELAKRAGITRSTVAVHISNLTKKGLITGRGYIVKNAPYAVVCGGVNMDIGGVPFKTLIGHDSNPGCVRSSLGGVGRNIAHNMALLDLDVRMVTALGDDLYAQRISNSCRELGIDLSASLTVPGGHTSTYLFISDEKGDMELAVSDMEIYDSLTEEFIKGKMQLFDRASLVVIDTNIPENTIRYIAENCKAPLFLDPVSTAKAKKAASVIGKFHTLKPNRIEAQILSGVEITDDKSLEKCADVLLEKGLERVFISLGADGVYAAEKGAKGIKVPCFDADMVNTTGCGDAFMAALAWGYIEGFDLEQSAKAGLAAAAVAMEGKDTINPLLSSEKVSERAGLFTETV